MAKQNYWLSQKQTKNTKQSVNQNQKRDQGHHGVKEVPKVKILNILEKTKLEHQHYQSAYEYAIKTSSSTSTRLRHVYIDCQEKLIFDPALTDDFNSLWQQGEVAQLVCFPQNWKSITLHDLTELLKLDLELDDEDEEWLDWNQLSADDRFDLLYEVGLKVYEKPQKRVVVKVQKKHGLFK